MKQFFVRLGEYWRGVRDLARELWEPVRRLFQSVMDLLFKSDQYGSWVRLFFFLLVFMIFTAAIVPILEAIIWVYTFFFSDVLPYAGRILDVLYDLFTPGEPLPPVEVPTAIWLPQPGLSEKLRLFTTSQRFFSLGQAGVVALIPLGLSFIVAAHYFQYLHNLPRFWAALGYILRAVFPLPRPKIKLENGNVVQKAGQLPFHRFGGPAQVSGDKYTSAFFEKSNGEVYTLSPGEHELVGAYDRIRAAYFVGEGEIEVTTANLTRDGIRVFAKGACFRYSIWQEAGSNPAPDSESFPPVEKMVYRHWLGNDWDKPDKRQKGVRELVKTELHQFISQNELAFFISSATMSDRTAQAGYQHLNPFRAFADSFSQSAGKYRFEGATGAMLTLEWLGRGEWIIQEGVNPEEQIQAWYQWLENRRRFTGTYFAAEKSETWRKEIQKLLKEISLEEIANMHANPEEIARELVVAYKEVLNQILQSETDLEPALVEDIQIVIGQIDRLCQR